MKKYKKGSIVRGYVTGIEAYGFFLVFDEQYTGLVHISEVSHGFVKDINEFVKIGDEVLVEVLEVDELNRHLKLSVKNLEKKIVKNQSRYAIEETKNGFRTLEYHLPFWIKDEVDKLKIK